MKQTNSLITEFNISGFPVIKVYETYFEVKSVEFTSYRRFNYEEVARIEYYKGGGNWATWPTVHFLQAKFEPYILRIFKKNGGDWEYNAPAKHSKDFEDFISMVRARC